MRYGENSNMEMTEFLMNQCKEGKYQAVLINENGFVFVTDIDTLKIAKKMIKMTSNKLTKEGKC